MVLDSLGEGLKNSLQKIVKAVFVNDRLVDELVRDIQRALLHADVNVKLVMDLSKRIKERALAEKTVSGVSQREHLIRIVYEELVNLFGTETKGITIGNKRPHTILLVGLMGSGKTTSAGKLAKYYSARGYKIALVGLDIHRPAAMDQLAQVGAKVGVDVYASKKEKDVKKLWGAFQDAQKTYDVVIIDSAGRDALSADLIKEIEAVVQMVKPDERLLVLSADIGQAALQQAQQFHTSCHISGIIVTKLDGTAKGGGSITACAVTGAPIVFLGVGEKPTDLETFNPSGFVGRLLGMGDIQALLEKAQGVVSQEEAEELSQRLVQGDFNLLDLYSQIEAMKKMGPIGKVLEMVPGLGGMKLPKEMLDVQDEKFGTWKHILKSCTKEELEDPEIIGSSRIERIAKGSGASVSDVRELLKHYKQTKKLMKMMKGDPEKMMKKFGAQGLRMKK